jgi:hypothetical protein
MVSKPNELDVRLLMGEVEVKIQKRSVLAKDSALQPFSCITTADLSVHQRHTTSRFYVTGRFFFQRHIVVSQEEGGPPASSTKTTFSCHLQDGKGLQ